jgi:hypothetical protein
MTNELLKHYDDEIEYTPGNNFEKEHIHPETSTLRETIFALIENENKVSKPPSHPLPEVGRGYTHLMSTGEYPTEMETLSVGTIHLPGGIHNDIYIVRGAVRSTRSPNLMINTFTLYPNGMIAREDVLMRGDSPGHIEKKLLERTDTTNITDLKNLLTDFARTSALLSGDCPF